MTKEKATKEQHEALVSLILSYEECNKELEKNMWNILEFDLNTLCESLRTRCVEILMDDVNSKNNFVGIEDVPDNKGYYYPSISQDHLILKCHIPYYRKPVYFGLCEKKEKTIKNSFLGTKQGYAHSFIYLENSYLASKMAKYNEKNGIDAEGFGGKYGKYTFFKKEDHRNIDFEDYSKKYKEYLEELKNYLQDVIVDHFVSYANFYKYGKV